MLYHDTRGLGPDLVLLHGWGMNAAVWGPLAEELAHDFRVTCIELPGHGESRPLASGSLADWAAACLDAAPERAVWLGWSLGALLALQAALQAPRRVSRLLLAAGTPRFVQGPDWPHAVPRATLEQFASALVRDPLATLDRFLALQVRGSPDARDTLRRLREGIRQRPPARPHALEQGLGLLGEGDLRSHLAAVDCPSLWLLGQRDTLVPPEIGEAVGRYMPGARVELLAGAGHASFLSHLPDFAGRLRERLL